MSSVTNDARESTFSHSFSHPATAWSKPMFASASKFRVPTITTDKAGYGMWIREQGGPCSIEAGAQVIHRTDSNWGELIASVADALFRFSQMTPKAVEEAREAAAGIAEKAEWKHFFPYYEQAYKIALKQTKDKRKPKKP